jgi:penicillin-binding protein A
VRDSERNSRQQRAKHRASLTFRMNVLFFLIFLIFTALIFRLGYMQIVKGEEYVRELQRTEEVRVNTSVPRGRILDRYGRILVDNAPENAITYTKLPSTKRAEMIEIAEQLAELIEMPTKRVTIRDKQDFWIIRNNKEAQKKVSQSEIQAIKDENPEIETKELNAQVDKLIRERITEEELASIDGYELEVAAIFREMLVGYNLSPQIIKSENVTNEEFARVSERLSDLPGVNTTTDWKRVRIAPIAVLGRTTVPSKGLPKAKLNYFLAREYSRNDRVGESYFEAQYEELLQGQKSVVKNVTNKAGQVVETITTYEGEPGKDLVTTIDYELQQRTSAIVENELLEMKKSSISYTADRAFLVMMNPQTGEVLSIVGKKIETDPETGQTSVVDYSYGAITTSYEVGSTVKPATLLTGYREGAIKMGQKMVDEPIRLGGSKVQSSVFNRGGRIQIDDLYAIERSSNVYMFKTVMAMSGLQYYAGMPYPKDYDTLQKLRNGYAQFGLGVLTEIDLPGEAVGVEGVLNNGGLLLNYAIGQFDSYTPMQLAQYVSTIANGGYRLKPRLLKEVRNPSSDGQTLGTLVQEVEPTVLNRIDNTEEEIAHVQEGMRRVYTGDWGSAKKAFAGASYTGAGKTGTAQRMLTDYARNIVGVPTVNYAHIGYAPFENPEIAYAVIVPWANTNFDISLPISNTIARKAADAYFELKAKYEAEGLLNSVTNQSLLPTPTEEQLGEGEEEKVVNE